MMLNGVSAAFLALMVSSAFAVPVEDGPLPTLPVNNIAGKPAPVTGTLITGSMIGSSTLTAGQSIPTGYYNPNGPFYNPADYTPLPFTWPGKPSNPSQTPPARPTSAPFPSGGSGAANYKAPAWVSKDLDKLSNSLPQSYTNGNSPWGLLDCPKPNPYPIVFGTTCGAPPRTGVVRKYAFSVSYQRIAPDGVTRNGLVINGGFPGPLIEANWGDTIEVTVKNDLPDEGTTIHWHGLLQNRTQFMDGVPAVSQCPIAPGASYTYTFQATLYGTSWYHSHYSAQYNGGALGPIVIHGPKTADYDVDIGPVMLSDWYHADYFSLVNLTMNGGVPASNNNLINGKMNYPCVNTTLPCIADAGISKFQFRTGKKYRLRLINVSSEGIQKFSIDGHNLTVIANDFVPIKPYTTSYVTLGVAQRSDVIVTATGKTGQSFFMRSNLGSLGGGCSVTDGVSPEAVAAVYYQGADTNSLPTTTSGLTTAQLGDCGNDPLTETVALCSITPDPAPPSQNDINIVFGNNGTNFVWFMNNSSFRGDYNDPVLPHVHNGNLSFPTEWNTYNLGTNSSVRIVIYNHFQFGAHPMHVSDIKTLPLFTTQELLTRTRSFTATISMSSPKGLALGTGWLSIRRTRSAATSS
jgi:FtsP/CotA-like multicopper oxidase with cupredoxin domain